MTAISVFDSPAGHALGWALVHFVWQGALAALILAVALAVIPRRAARARYAAACGILALLAAAPVLTGVAFWSSQRPAAPMPSAAAPSSSPASLSFLPEVVMPDSPEPPALAVPAPWPSRIDRTLPWIVALWLMGVALMAVRLLGGLGRIARLRRTSTPAPPEWRDRLAHLAHRLGLRRAVDLLISARVDVPTAIGWLRPAILLPASALTGMPAAHIEMLLAHELAHIRRHDYLVNLVQAIVEAALFYHPAVWWVSARVRQEREHCCDDAAIALCGGDAAGYVGALAALEERRLAPPALAASGGSLLQRARRLLGRDLDRRSHAITPARWLAGGALLAMLAIGALLLPLHADEAADAPMAALDSATAEDEIEDSRQKLYPNVSISNNTTIYGENAIIEKSDPSGTKKTLRSGLNSAVIFWLAFEDDPPRLDPEYAKEWRALKYEVAVGRDATREQAEAIRAELQNNGYLVKDVVESNKVHYALIDAKDSYDAAIALTRELNQAGFDVHAWRVAGTPQKEAGLIFESADAVLDPINQPREAVRLVVDSHSLTLEGEEASWNSLPKLLEAIPDRPNTVLEFAIADDTMTVRESRDAFNRALTLSRNLDFHHFSDVGIHPMGSKADPSIYAQPKSQRQSVRFIVDESIESSDRPAAPVAPKVPKAPDAPEPQAPPAPPAPPELGLQPPPVTPEMLERVQKEIERLQARIAEWQQSPDWQRLQEEIRRLPEMDQQTQEQVQKEIKQMQDQITQWQQRPDWQRFMEEIRRLQEWAPQMREQTERLDREFEVLRENLRNNPKIQEALEAYEREIQKLQNDLKNRLGPATPAVAPEPPELDTVKIDLIYRRQKLEMILYSINTHSGINCVAMGQTGNTTMDIMIQGASIRAALDNIVSKHDWFWRWNGETKVIEIWDLDSWNKKYGESAQAVEARLDTTLVSLEMTRAPVIDVLRRLAREHELNIILREQDVTGDVTISVKEVPLGTALESVLKSNGLAYIIEPGGILRIVPREAVAPK